MFKHLSDSIQRQCGARQIIWQLPHLTTDAFASAKITLERFKDRKYWTPRTPKEEEPRETFLLKFKSDAHGWARVQSRITPVKAFKRYRMTLSATCSEGTIWFDDLALRPMGTAGAPALGGDLNMDLLGAPPSIEGTNDNIALLDLISEEAGSTSNLLVNASFEKPMTNSMASAASDKPSAISPTKTPTTWMKAE